MIPENKGKRTTWARKGAFELNGQLGLGLGQSFFDYENTQNLSGSILLSDYRNLGIVFLRQNVTGYASLSISAKWLVSKSLSWGLHGKWLQQIGRGKWFASNPEIRIRDLASSSLVPLQIT